LEADEGGRWGGSGVGWRRDSPTHRYYHIAPSSVSCADSFPRGEAYVLCYVGVIAMVFFYNRTYRICQSLPLGGRWAGQRPSRMRASVEGSTALGIPLLPPENSSKYLNFRPFLAIINMKNRNAAVYGCSRTHRPTQVHTHLHSGHPAAPHKYYTLFSSPSQGEKNKRYIFYVLH